MGGFSSFAVSFSIISVLTGCISAYEGAFADGGAATLGIGWPIVSVGTMIVALAMAELASAFPTAGALYHWSAMLGGSAMGWLTAMINIAGQLAVLCAIDYGCASGISMTFGLGAPMTVYGVVALSHVVINVLSLRLVALLNDLSASVHVIGVAVIVGALFLFGRSQPVTFFFTPTKPFMGFAVGLTLSVFTFTGYDASAHLAEETRDPARRTPWGILTSVGVSAIAGYLLLAALTLALHAGGKAVPLDILESTLGHGFGVVTMCLALMAMWFCGLSSLTSSSRTIFAFARDRGLPTLLAHVNKTTRTPIRAIVAVKGGSAIVLLLLGHDDAVFYVAAKVATMTLYASYGLPIALGLLARRSGRWKTKGPFQLGRMSKPIALLAVAWSVVAVVICGLPPDPKPAVIFTAVTVILVLLTWLWARKHFAGPSVKLEDWEIR